MACTSILALLRACGSGVIAGTEQFYISAYKDLSANTITQLTYSADTAGTIQQIYMAAAQKFVAVDLLKSTSGEKDTATIDPSKGLNFFTQNFTLVLSDLTPANFAFIQSIRSQPVVILYKARTGTWFAIGLNGQLTAKSIDGGSGIVETDAIGWTIVFESISKDPAPIVNTAIVAGIIS